MSAILLQQQRVRCFRKSIIGARTATERCITFMSRELANKKSAPAPLRSQRLLCENLELEKWRRAPSLPSESIMRHQRPELPGDDYRIYQQNIDLDSFFGDQPKYEKVSDVCLVNDHYMLVKMPDSEPQLLRRETQAAEAIALSNGVKKSRWGSGPKMPRCFKCNRSSRVSPILEELEDAADPQQGQVVAKTWTACDDVEVFESSTRIIHPKSPSPLIFEQPKNNSVETNLQLESNAPPQPHPVVRSALYWFLWPFRRRSGSNARTKVNAAVHKTYFVRWTKPPDTLWQGYGVERADKIAIRRCRSALF
ncbi:uncharacterized protein LOC115631856 [Scaptodrosophila lebanonensis]|uniref:Uncharacterized protein LOC115631856 n=1 Tax=Drosophila lebanonensis TaxID=7225 RepID=A0A6J2UBI5_DROLE|nr:uncharacterized protein LOC115631856 [Scaptodrosophila lebanonensis]